MRTPYARARRDIETGDILLRKRSSLISLVGRSEYSHAAMAIWLSDQNTLMLAEFREFWGSGIVTMSDRIAECPKQFDLYRPTCSDQIKARAAMYFVRQMGKPYNARQIVQLALVHLPFVQLAATRFGLDPRYTDTTLSRWDAPKVCSSSIEWAYRKAASDYESDWDLVPRLNDLYCEPGDIARGNCRMVFENLYYGAAA